MTQKYGYACGEVVENATDIVIAQNVTTQNCKLIAGALNAMSGISDPEAWVRHAREVARLAIAQDFPVELANALCDMKAAEGAE